MSEPLDARQCTPCQGGIAPLARDEAERLLAHVSGWQLRDEGARIDKDFRFRNFREALDFVTRIGELAETQGHHPDITFGWGWANVSWQTKKIHGLHENDFIMAAKTDALSEH